MDDTAALNAITTLLSGSEWNPNTLNEVAEIIRETGRVIDDTEEG